MPVGAVIVKDGKIIAEGKNERETKQNALSHAEIEAINNACAALSSWRLDDCELYVTLEPCPMSAGAIINSRIKNLNLKKGRTVFTSLAISIGFISLLLVLCLSIFIRHLLH